MKDLRPILSERDYERALAEVEELWGAKAGTPKGDRLDILATLIEAYQTEHYPMDPPDPIEAIKFRMEQSGLAAKDLEPAIGQPSRVYEVLAGTRGLSLRMIRNLNNMFDIPAEILIQPSRKRHAHV